MGMTMTAEQLWNGVEFGQLCMTYGGCAENDTVVADDLDVFGFNVLLVAAQEGSQN